METDRATNWRDALLPTGIAVLAVAEMAALRLPGWGYGAALEVLACALLVFRRRNALLFATLAQLAVLVIPWVGPALNKPSVPLLIWAVCFYSLARWIDDLRGLAGIALAVLVVFLDYTLVDTRQHDWSDVIFVSALVIPPYALGRITRKLALQGELLEQQQELVKREAVRAERDRIAREMHDVIAHSVSAMVVQTAAAQDMVHTDPDRAHAVLAEVADTGRRAIAETGRLLHVLRDPADELGLEPAPGLARLPALVDRFRAGGLDVDLLIDGPLPPVPAGVDVSAYRIVQEALTNALRYGADRTASLRVIGTATALSIEASNPSNGSTGSGSGLGLLGMAERVALLGGSLSHGVTGTGRFELAATLPLAGEQT